MLSNITIYVFYTFFSLHVLKVAQGHLKVDVVQLQLIKM